MADEEGPLSADERVRRSAARTALNVITGLVALAVLAAWPGSSW